MDSGNDSTMCPQVEHQEAAFLPCLKAGVSTPGADERQRFKASPGIGIREDYPSTMG